MTELTGGSTAQHTITIHLVVRGADRAANWYVQALGAEERGRVPVPDGRFMQIELRFGDSTVMIADEFPEMGVVSPLTLGGVYSTLSIHTDDVEALWERARAGRRRSLPAAPGHVLGRPPRRDHRSLRPQVGTRATRPRRSR
jgi:uncharacterized glyoxalase superfamily protein PhnB